MGYNTDLCNETLTESPIRNFTLYLIPKIILTHAIISTFYRYAVLCTDGILKTVTTERLLCVLTHKKR